MPDTNPLLVEIWSDVACPFCFIGKRQFDDALRRFPQRDDVRVTWKSFQLNPELRTDPDLRIEAYLAREKGIPASQVAQMNARVREMGHSVSIDFAIERAVVANTFRAHRLVHLAHAHGLQAAAEARQLGVSGVPFFVLDQKYAVSGAQGSDLMLRALQRAYAERRTV